MLNRSVVSQSCPSHSKNKLHTWVLQHWHFYTRFNVAHKTNKPRDRITCDFKRNENMREAAILVENSQYNELITAHVCWGWCVGVLRYLRLRGVERFRLEMRERERPERGQGGEGGGGCREQRIRGQPEVPLHRRSNTFIHWFWRTPPCGIQQR